MAQKSLPFVEFVTLIALMMSLVALSIDAMLPALAEIGASLGVAEPNDNQLIISVLFIGLAVGQIIYGPLSDSVGRKPAIYLGFSVFIAGTLLSLFATSFTLMLIGRALQGLGAASSRIVTLAIVRDQYAGREMARVMSFAMVVFILVPVLAPAIGQGILLVASWRAIFGVFLLLAAVALLWFGTRQPETLAIDKRIPFNLRTMARAVAEICAMRVVLGYTITTGLVFGAFIGFLTSAQQLFQMRYELGVLFPLHFAAMALSVGFASLLNGHIVMRFGMRRLTLIALTAQALIASAFLVLAIAAGGLPPLWAVTTYLMAGLFCFGMTFGNLNALAMEPLGRLAGIGSAVVGCLATGISVPLGTFIGQSYDGTVLPMVGGFAGLGAAATLTAWWTGRSERAN